MPAPISVKQYDLHGNFIKEYKSVKEAQDETGISNSNITHCARYEVRTAGGYLWRYANEPAPEMVPEPKYLWTITTTDKYELPLYVAESLEELSKACGVDKKSISSVISRFNKGTIEKCRFHKIEVDN